MKKAYEAWRKGGDAAALASMQAEFELFKQAQGVLSQRITRGFLSAVEDVSGGTQEERGDEVWSLEAASSGQAQAKTDLEDLMKDLR